MCTALGLQGNAHLFGRTLDLEYSYDEEVIITPRMFCLEFLSEKPINSHLAIIGVGCVADGKPLYYDAANEAGLSAAGLNFPENAVYFERQGGFCNLASFEVIPFVLSRCKSVGEAKELFKNVRITPDDFSKTLKSTPLHWIFADRTDCITVESTASGLSVHENPFRVLTNDPPFCHHVTRMADYAHLSSRDPHNTLCPDIPISFYSRGMGGIDLPGDFSSFSRFVRTVFLSHHTTPAPDKAGEISRFFHIMDDVSVPKGAVKTNEGKDVLTVYTSCTDLDTGSYYYVTHKSRRIRALSFSSVPRDADTLYTVKMAEEEEISYLTPAAKRDTIGKNEIIRNI